MSDKIALEGFVYCYMELYWGLTWGKFLCPVPSCSIYIEWHWGAPWEVLDWGLETPGYIDPKSDSGPSWDSVSCLIYFNTVVNWIVISHMWLFKLIKVKENLKFSYSVTEAASHVLKNHIKLVDTLLDNSDTEHSIITEILLYRAALILLLLKLARMSSIVWTKNST